MKMDDYSKLYCKAHNLLKMTVKNREYFFKVSFRGKVVWIT
jgi:hypothetical protein